MSGVVKGIWTCQFPTLSGYRYCKDIFKTGAWLAQLVEHATVDLGVMSSSPTLGVEIT